MDIDADKLEAFYNKIAPEIEAVIGNKVSAHSGSTDCNIPLALGVPALAVGVCRGVGVHTREEYLIKDSVIEGLEIAIKTTATANGLKL